MSLTDSPRTPGLFFMKNKKQIIRAIRLTWDSLDTHLEGSVDKRLTGRVVGDRRFHKKCVEEYMFIIRVLIDQL